ncbi:DNA/RNA non-specific endonuclease [Streptomyces sp. DT224]|uniref:DNA/RNA non-specific endonuclease n=1 Tax=Streptomyces sp. DT224 TaxID=3393426 RepID=UPI003CEC413C
MIKAVLRVVHARPTGSTDTDTEHQRFVDDAFTRAQKDLGLTEEQLRGYFKMFPRPAAGSSYEQEFGKFVANWDDQEKDCTQGEQSWIYYQPLDAKDRATGAFGCLQKDAIKLTGRGAKPDSKDTDLVGSDTRRDGKHDPTGYQKGKGLARGHLIGRQLGGSGTEVRNLVPQYTRPNSVIQKGFEDRIAARISGGERIYYLAVPRYHGGSPIPYETRLYAIGSGGTNESAVVKNTPTGR